MRALLTTTLEGAGYDVRQAACGEEAINLARVDEPLLVILDIRLPGVCGYEVCRELRQEFGEGLPILFMSGERTQSFDRVGGLLLGADDYLVKPFARDELLARVRRLAQRPTGRGIAAKLTKREFEVLHMLAAGMTPLEVATDLVISRKTVATHIEHIFLKLGVRTRAQAVAVAYRDDLLDLISSSGSRVKTQAIVATEHVASPAETAKPARN